VVVGGGIIGLSCAHYLQRHGRPLPAPGVVRQGLRWLFDPESPFVIKARPDLALARWLMRFAWSARRQPMLKGIPTLRYLNRLSAALYAELARDAEAELSYHETGVLNTYATPDAFAHGRREAALLERYGVTSEVLEGDDVAAAEPGLRDGLAGGVLWPEDGYVDPASFVASLTKDLERRGVPILPHTEVLGISDDERRLDAVRRSASSSMA
jgi:D-amino-acid dehydrogenase